MQPMNRNKLNLQHGQVFNGRLQLAIDEDHVIDVKIHNNLSFGFSR